jgi:hypothetical protein
LGFSRGGAPAFVSPADHASCDPAHTSAQRAGIGAFVPLIERPIGESHLDAVDADPADEARAHR